MLGFMQWSLLQNATIASHLVQNAFEISIQHINPQWKIWMKKKSQMKDNLKTGIMMGLSDMTVLRLWF